MLDEFKSAGVFVNWWQQIRYDLKTIVSTGWHHTLIPDEYLISEHSFQQRRGRHCRHWEGHISELQAELAEAVEAAQEVVAYEPDEDEKVTATVIKKALKDLIDDLKDSTGTSAKRELDGLKAQDRRHIKEDREDKIKDIKSALKDKTDVNWNSKFNRKRLGGEGFKAESQELSQQAGNELANLDPLDTTDRKKINDA